MDLFGTFRESKDISEVKDGGRTEISPEAKARFDELMEEGGSERDLEREMNLEQTVSEYLEDIKNYSDCPDTLPDKPFNAKDLNRIDPEKVGELREEFSNKRAELIAEWESQNGREWPRYEEDVYILKKGTTDEYVKIRQKGDKYDAHHIQPLSLGGKNEASNLTPLRADVHMDHRGVHMAEGAYGRMEKIVGGMQE